MAKNHGSRGTDSPVHASDNERLIAGWNARLTTRLRLVRRQVLEVADHLEEVARRLDSGRADESTRQAAEELYAEARRLRAMADDARAVADANGGGNRRGLDGDSGAEEQGRLMRPIGAVIEELRRRR